MFGRALCLPITYSGSHGCVEFLLSFLWPLEPLGPCEPMNCQRCCVFIYNSFELNPQLLTHPRSAKEAELNDRSLQSPTFRLHCLRDTGVRQMLITSGFPQETEISQPNPSANPKWLGAPVCSGVVSQPACWLSSAGYPKAGIIPDSGKTVRGLPLASQSSKCAAMTKGTKNSSDRIFTSSTSSQQAHDLCRSCC